MCSECSTSAQACTSQGLKLARPRRLPGSSASSSRPTAVSRCRSGSPATGSSTPRAASARTARASVGACTPAAAATSPTDRADRPYASSTPACVTARTSSGV